MIEMRALLVNPATVTRGLRADYAQVPRNHVVIVLMTLAVLAVAPSVTELSLVSSVRRVYAFLKRDAYRV